MGDIQLHIPFQYYLCQAPIEEMDKDFVIMGHFHHLSIVSNDVGLWVHCPTVFLNSRTLNFLGIITLSNKQSSARLIEP